MADDGSEGLSPDGWLPDRISVGVLTRAFPPELVDEIIEVTGTREQRRRLLPARLMVYFVLALWLFRGRNGGYGQVIAKLADWLYGQQRGADLLAGQLAPGGRVDAGQGRQWWLPNISSLSRGRGKLGADPVRMLFEHVAGPTWAARAPGVFCCGLRVVSMDGSVTDVPDSEKNAAFFGLLLNQSRDGAFPQARGSRRPSPGPAACWAPRSAAIPTPSSRWPRTCWAASGRACWSWRTASSCPGPPPAPSSRPARTSCGAPPPVSPSSR